jgi:hypothetical protein
MQNHRAAFLAVLPLLLMGCASLPPWSPVPTGQTSIYGKIDTSVNAISFIAFSGNPGIAAISIEYNFGRAAPRYALIADGQGRAAIEEICAKYFEWQKRAVDNNVEIVKEIRTITLAQMYPSGSGWEPGGSRELRFVFSSRLDTNNTYHTTLRVGSRSFFEGRDQFVLEDQQVRDLADSLQDSAVAVGFDAAKKKQDTIDMFN